MTFKSLEKLKGIICGEIENTGEFANYTNEELKEMYKNEISDAIHKVSDRFWSEKYDGSGLVTHGIRECIEHIGMYSYDDIIKCATLDGTSGNIRKGNNEIRVMSVFTAQYPGANSRTVVTVSTGRLNEDDRLITDVLYIDGYFNEHEVEIALEIKKMFYKYDVDIIVADAARDFLITEELSEWHYDKESDMKYQPLTIINKENLFYDMAEVEDAQQVIYVTMQDYKATHLKLVNLKSDIENGRIKFPLRSVEAEANYEKEHGKVISDKDFKNMVDSLKLNYYTDTLIQQLSWMEPVFRDNNPYVGYKNNAKSIGWFESLAMGVSYLHDLRRKGEL